MAFLVYVACVLNPIPLFAETTIRISVASDGSQGNNWSYHPAISADGRFVVYESKATDLVLNDTNLAPDFFVRDLMTGITSRVSVASDGSEGTGAVTTRPWASLSADGRFVAFTSESVNLVDNDGNAAPDVFVHDRQTGVTVRASVSSNGAEANSMAYAAKLSADGRFVSFMSQATNLVAPQTAQWVMNIFVRDLQTAQTMLVSRASDSTPGNSSSNNPSMSSDGRYIAFDSIATNLVPDDTNAVMGLFGSGRDVFVREIQTGQTTRVSVASDGSQANGYSEYPSISGDGRYVAFVSTATNFGTTGPSGIEQIFLHDRITGTTSLISKASDGTVGDNDSNEPSISTDGRYVAFYTHATNLGGPSFNMYVHDVVTGQTQWVSKTAAGGAGNNWPIVPLSPAVISGNGRIITFDSSGDNYVDNDTNGEDDVFVVLPDDSNASIAPASLRFDGLQPGPLLPQSILVTNTTTSNMTIGSLFSTGRDSASFSIQNDGCSGKILVAGENCTVQVAYAPLSVGTQDARLVVPFYMQNFSSATAALTGNNAPDPDTALYGNGSSDSGKCFIATAAYGSYLDQHVVVLRKFRDSMLLTNAAGRALVDIYYRHAPPAAAIIERNESLRRLARWLLTPVVYCIQYPWLLFFAPALVIFRIVLKSTVRDGNASPPTRRSDR